MRLGLIGCQNSGKTTLINDMLANWSMYTTPEKTYRDLIKEKNLPCNRQTTPETQQLIMDLLCDQILATSKNDNIITDRTPLDALVFSLHAYGRGVAGFTDEFVEKQILLAREACKSYDILFFIPIIEKYDIPLVQDGLRDADPTYRQEIDNIFKELIATYHAKTGPFFDFEDCPAIIEIFGNQKERIEMIKLYIGEDGNPYGDDESLIADGLISTDGSELVIEKN